MRPVCADEYQYDASTNERRLWISRAPPVETQRLPTVTEDRDVDPRVIRSRKRLLDASAALLETGGIEAVTIEGVTKASKVARTTLYRHFSNSAQLVEATLERLLPQAIAPAPAAGNLRDRLVELLSTQARLLAEAPIQLTTLAWVALGATDPAADNSISNEPVVDLRAKVAHQYREPFDQVLLSAEARAELGNFDVDMALCQLIGPLVFARLTGLRQIGPDQCVCIVEDFLATRRRH